MSAPRRKREPSAALNADHPVALAIFLARTWADMTRAELGEEIALTGGQIGRWERGDWVKPPKPAMLHKVAEATGVDEMCALLPDLLSDSAAKRIEATVRAQALRRRKRPGTS